MPALKIITLMAAITQSLAVLCSLFSFVQMAGKLKWEDNANFFVMQPVFITAEIMMAVFLFVLFSRQKSN